MSGHGVDKRGASTLCWLCALVVFLLSGQTALAASYEAVAETFAWIDPSTHTDAVWLNGAGCSGGSAAGDDDHTAELSLGFSFTFGTTAYTTVRIVSNGRLQFNNNFCGFGSANSGTPRRYPYPMPDSRLTDTLRIYGADLIPSAGGSVRYAALGAAPNRRFVVTWTNVPEWNAVGSAFNLQVILHENGDFTYQFGAANNPSQGHAQIGWELSDADYALYPYADITALASTAVRFTAHTAQPLGYYPMDEAQWTGTAGEVRDASGNANHGDRVGGAQTVSPGYICRGGQIPGNNDAVDTGLDVDTAIGVRGSVTLWFNSEVNWNSGGTRMLLDGSRNLGSGSADKYFYLVKRNNGALTFRIEDGNDADLVATTPALNFAAGTWHQVAVTWDIGEDADWLQIYVDGARQATSRGNLTNPLNISGVLGNLNTLYVAGSRDSGLGGAEYTNSSARGVVDEVRVYQEVLSPAQINADLNATHECLVGAWHFDEPAWAGAAGEVVDYSGNGHDGAGNGGATTAQLDPALPGNPGTCRYGVFDGIDDHVAIPDADALDVPEEFTIAAWINPALIPSGGTLKSIFSKDTNYEFHLNSAGQIFWWWHNAGGATRTLTSGGTPIAANAWTHIAVVYSRSTATQRIYINGVQRASASYNEALETNNLPLYIGADVATGSGALLADRFFAGLIDEVRVYALPLSQAEIVTVMNERQPCAVVLDHFAIDIGAGTASTCQAQPVTITAEDAANNPVTDYAGTVAIATSSNHGNWSINTATNPTQPSPDNDDDGAVGYTFAAGDSGSIVLDLANVHADDLTITVTDASAGVSSASAVLSFRDNAFVVTPTTCTGASCPGTGSTELVAGRDHGFNVALWRRDATSGDCAIATGYDSSVPGVGPLKAWLVRNGDDPGGAAPLLEGVSLPGAVPGAANVTLSFTNGEAPFTLATSDVGKYVVSLRDDASGFAVDELGNARPIDGASATLTARPFALAVTGVAAGGTPNPGVDVPGGAAFIAAGADFQATVQGVLWQAADDAGGDGVPGGGVDLSDNAAAPAYAWTTTLDSGGALSLPYQPAGGVRGTLTRSGVAPVSVAAGAFSGGGATPTDLQYGEVGSFTMGASATGYLNTAGVDVSGWSGVIGRFTPFDFAVAANAPQFATQCPAGAFTYVGQVFGYAVQPVLSVTARNALGGTTQNYTGAWFRITNASLTNKLYTALTGTLDTSGLLAPDPVIADLAGGNATLTFSSGAGLRFQRAAPVAPFDAEIALSIDVRDADGVIYDPAAANNGNYAIGSASAGGGIAFDNGKAQRWGRVALTNAFGSELVALPVPLAIEYWEDVDPGPSTVYGFVTNAADSCTALAAGDFNLPPGSFTGNLNVGETAVSGVTLAGGSGFVTLSAPGAGNDGGVDVVGAVPGHLDFDWDGNNSHDNDPTARATFGIYAGPPRRIYLREVY